MNRNISEEEYMPKEIKDSITKMIMKEETTDDENYMSDCEKEVIIDKEIDKLLSDLPDYRREEPYHKYNLESIGDKEPKFIHGQKEPIEPTEPTELKSASKKMRSGKIRPKGTKKLRSMLVEFTIMEYADGNLQNSGIFTTRQEFITIEIPDSPFTLKMPVRKLREFLYHSISNSNPGYVTFEKGREKFTVAIEINPQILLDSNEAELI